MKSGFKKKPEIKSGKKKPVAKSAKLELKKAQILSDALGQIKESFPPIPVAKHAGRPRSEPAQMPIFDTLQQCSAATGVPISALKMAKASGCDAFRHGRVNFGEFIRWFFAQGTEEDNTDWNKENKRLDALIKRVKYAELEKRVIDFGEVVRFLNDLVGRCFFAELERMGQEFPPVLKGRDENEIQARLSDEIDKIKQDLADKLHSWSTQK